MPESIKVYYEPLRSVLGVEYYHETIVYTDSDGNSYYQSSGPTVPVANPGLGDVSSAIGDAATNTASSWGTLAAGTPTELTDGNAAGITQSANGTAYASTTVATGDDLSAQWAAIQDEEAAITSQNLTYSPASQNSNSMANTALEAAGIDPPSDTTTGMFGSDWAPGADNILDPSLAPSSDSQSTDVGSGYDQITDTSSEGATLDTLEFTNNDGVQQLNLVDNLAGPDQNETQEGVLQQSSDGSSNSTSTIYNDLGQAQSSDESNTSADGTTLNGNTIYDDGQADGQTQSATDEAGNPIDLPAGQSDDQNGVDPDGSDVPDNLTNGISPTDRQNFWDGPVGNGGDDDDDGTNPDPGPFTNPIGDAGPPDAFGPLGDAEIDPLVIDMSGNGLHLEARSAFTPYFNFTGGNFAQNADWIGSGTAFLAIPGENGEISGADLISGFSQLAALDSNGDGVIDASDPAYSSLVIWQDLNNDGIAEGNEVLSLAQAGIVSISLNTTTGGYTVNGVQVEETAVATMVDGSTRQLAAVDLSASSYYTEYTGASSVDSTIESLPNLRGYGSLSDLQVAMGDDSTLETLVETLVATDPSNLVAFNTALQGVLSEWGGVAGEETSDTAIFDLQKLDFMRAYLGQSITFGPLQQAEGPWFSGQSNLLQEGWNDIYTSLKARVLLQMPDSAFASNFQWDANSDLVLPASSLTSGASFQDGLLTSIENLASDAPTDDASKVAYWANALLIVDASVEDIGQYVSLDTSSIASALTEYAPSFISSQIIAAVASGTLNVAEGTEVGSLVGTTGSDLAIVSQSNSSFTGFGGSDEIIVEPGLGNTEINEVDNSASPDNILVLDGVSPADVSVTADAAGDIFLHETDGSQIKLDSQLSGPATGEENADGHEFIYFNPNTQFGVQAVEFDDGTVWTAQDIVSEELAAATSGNDTLVGTTASETFDGRGGNDVEVGNGGNDTFVFDSGYGHLEINEADENPKAYNVLQFGTGIDPSNVTVTGDSDGNIILTDGVSGDQVTIDGMLTQTLDSAILGVQAVEFANGTVWSAQTVLAKEADTTDVTESFYGTSGADTFSPATGKVYEQGDGGGDTFDFDRGDGKLYINETDYSSDTNTLAFGTGISASDITVTSTSDDNLVLTDGTSGDSITVDGMMVGSQYGIQQVTFADDTTWSRSELINRALTGTSGNDVLYGSSGADTFDGLGGSDYEEGNGGGDTFVFDSGYGHLEINEIDSSTSPDNVLRFGPGIDPSDVHVTADAQGDILLSDGVTGDQVKIDAMLNGSWYGVQGVSFSDGTTWTKSEVIAKELSGTSGSDAIYGTSGADTIDGGGGNDFEQGFGGGDTFVYDVGYGHLEISETEPTGTSSNVLSLGEGITAADLSASSDANGDLILTDGTSGDDIKIDGMMNGPYYGVQAIDFSDGSSLSWNQATQLALAGTTGDDSIYGTNGPDVIDGSGGNDYEQGNGGNDTFVYSSGYGHLEINEADNNPDANNVLQLGAGITPDQVSVSQDSSGDIILTDGTSGDQITLDKMLDSAVFNGGTGTQYGVQYVDFADGTKWAALQIVDMGTTGTTGNDELYGTDGPDVIDGKGGNDYENGESGGDTFIYNRGYGDLEIVDNDYNGTPDNILKLGPGITLADLKITADIYGNLYIGDGTSGDQVKIDYGFASTQEGIQDVALADGTTLDHQDLLNLEETGTTGNDTIFGTSAAETFDGKGGNDYINGGGGNDTFIFNLGYGHLEIDEFDSGSSPDNVLQLGSGISPADISITGDIYGDLILTDGVTGDQIKLDRELNSAAAGVQSIVFADSTVWDRADIIDAGDVGTTGNDRLYGTSAPEVFDGKGGDDYENGGGGNDTFIFNSGYGQLEIDEYDSGSSPANVLQLGTGIDPSDVKLTGDDLGNVYLADGVSGDQVKLDRELNSPAAGVQDISFSDGTVWDRSDIIAAEETGTTGNDTIYGTSAAETFDGKGGDDVIYGGGGSDTFIYNPGYGDLEINEDSADSSDNTVLQLGAGITPSDITAQANVLGNIYLSDGTTGDVIQLDHELFSTTAGVDTIEFADGTTWDRQDIINAEETGTTGNDTIYGTTGPDTLDGKGGTDVIYGDGGGDTIIFDPHYGSLQINEDGASSGDNNVLQLGAGITAADIGATADISGNIYLSDGITGDLIELDHQLGNTVAGVNEIEFSDGTTWNRQDINDAEETGTTGNDNIWGTTSADTFDGKGGNDVIHGNGGADTFIFNEGYGQLEISEYDGSGSVLELGTGINPSDIAVTASGSNLVLSDTVTGDAITLDGEDASSAYGVQTVAFADGTNWSRGDLLTALDDSTGYSLDIGSGHTTVNVGSISPGSEPLELGAGIDADDIALQNDSSGDLTVSLLNSSDSITLDNDLQSNWWGVASVVQELDFSDGSTMDIGQTGYGSGTPWTFTWIGTSADTTLTGSTYGSNVFDLGPDSDTVSAGSGSNTFNFAEGDGNVTVDLNGGTGTLNMGSGISSSDLIFQTDSSKDLIVLDTATGDSITFDDDLAINWWGTSSAVQEINLADGTTINVAMTGYMNGSPPTFTWVGTDTNTTLTGSNLGANVFDLGAGGDTVSAGSGINTFNFGEGDGNATVDLNGGTGTLNMGAGISSSDLIFQTDSSNDLIVRDTATGDSITFDDALTSNWWGTSSAVQEINLAGGTTINVAMTGYMNGSPPTFTWIGTDTNTTLTGSNLGSNVFDLGAGSDTVTAGTGANTFNFGEGDGNATVNLEGSTGTLNLGPGITASDVTFQTDSSNDLIVSLSSGDSITFDHALTSNWWGTSSAVQEINLADDTTINVAMTGYMNGSPPTFTWTGTDTNTTLTGSSLGSNVFDLGSGDDTVTATGSSNTINYGDDVDHATIGITSSGSDNELDFGSSLTDQSLWFTQSGNDLQVSVLGTSSEVTVQNWFSGSSDQLQEIKADGLEIDSQVNSLISAMATFANDNPGFDPTAATTMPTDTTLQSAIAASWH